MFNLSRYFSTVSFSRIVLAAGVLGPLYRQLSLQQMQDLAESRNVAMAQVLQNSLRTPLEALMSDAVGRDDEYLRQSESAASLQASVLELLRDTTAITSPGGVSSPVMSSPRPISLAPVITDHENGFPMAEFCSDPLNVRNSIFLCALMCEGVSAVIPV